jgi:hypothetical protein
MLQAEIWLFVGPDTVKDSVQKSTVTGNNLIQAAIAFTPAAGCRIIAIRRDACPQLIDQSALLRFSRVNRWLRLLARRR